MMSTSVKLPEPVVEAFDRSPQSKSEILRQKAYEALLDYAVGRCAITGEVLFRFDTYHEHRPETDNPIEYNVIPYDTILVDSDALGDAVSQEVVSGGKSQVSFDYLAEVGEVLYQAERQYLHDILGAQFPGFTDAIKHEYSEHAALLLQNGETKSELVLVRDLLLWISREDPANVSIQAVWDAASEKTKQQIVESVHNGDVRYVSLNVDDIHGIDA